MGEKTWFKNNRPLAASTTGVGRIQQLPNGNLLITRVVQGDEGMYTCTVQNSLGTASSSGNLTVLRKYMSTRFKRLVGFRNLSFYE